MLSRYELDLILAYVIVMIVFGVVAGSRGSWLRTSSAERLTFQTPPIERVFPLMVALSLAVGFPLIANAPRAGNPAEAPAFVFLGVLFCGMVLLMLWLGGAQRLEIDLQQRTYRYTRHWLVFLPASRRAGSLDEMSGVCCTEGGMLLLVFKNRPSFAYGYTLGRFTSKQSASCAAEQIARAAGLPIVRVPWAG